jgi:hypothetical protein
MTVRLKRGVEHRLVWSRPASSIAPFCSSCFSLILDDDSPLMIWNAEGACAQFCEACEQMYIEADSGVRYRI